MNDDPQPKPSNIIPFGKYKGRSIEEVLIDDPSYLQWCADQDWFRARFNVLYQVIINRGAESQETPEHNALQVRFLDHEFCLRFLKWYRPDIDQLARDDLQEILEWSIKRIEEELARRKREETVEQSGIDHAERYERGEQKSWEYRPFKSAAEYRTSARAIQADIARINAKLIQQRNAQLGDITFCFEQQFEIGGIDVVLTVQAVSVALKIEARIFGYYHHNQEREAIKIELKPSIGDDYPAVLRQMRANKSNVLLVREYRGQGATQEQFVKTFAAASIRVVFLDDLQ
jgi:uncharacterized protein (DUF3820 family)